MRRHTFDPISFILGGLFAAIGLTFLFGDVNIGDIHIAVVWPLPLIVIGLLMLMTTVQRRTRNQPAPAPAAPIRDEAEPAGTSTEEPPHADARRVFDDEELLD
jgi:hypothetical protein